VLVQGVSMRCCARHDAAARPDRALAELVIRMIEVTLADVVAAERPHATPAET
jgi:hypothetical protein